MASLVIVPLILLLFYINSFILKRRQKEFGLYNVLGMEKRHIGIVLIFETLYIGLFSIALGLAFGILFDKLMYLAIARILQADHGVGFFISWKTIVITSVLFIHVAFSLPMIIRIMSMLAFTNVKLFALCSLGCFAAFSVIYVIVYLLTAKVYYWIVKAK